MSRQSRMVLIWCSPGLATEITHICRETHQQPPGPYSRPTQKVFRSALIANTIH